MNQNPSTKKRKKAEMRNTPQSKQETRRISMRNIDEDSGMDTTNMDADGQRTGGDMKICMETNTSTSEQNEVANKTVGTTNAPPQDASVGVAGRRLEQTIRYREKGIATDYSGGGQEDSASLTGETTMAIDTTSPKRTEPNVSPRERTRSKTRASKPCGNEPLI
jgi:hypothetical protein